MGQCLHEKLDEVMIHYHNTKSHISVALLKALQGIESGTGLEDLNSAAIFTSCTLCVLATQNFTSMGLRNDQ